jgi:hypothetical protein
MSTRVEIVDPAPFAGQPGSTVIASNLSYIDAALIRPAGARALPSSFHAHVFVKGETHVIETAAALNLEVV